MNQILITEKGNKGKGIGIDTKKVIAIFATLSIAFALIFVIPKTYNLIKEKGKIGTPIDKLNKPEITISREDNVCKIDIAYDVGIDKITYWWNDDEVIEKNMNGSTSPISLQLMIPGNLSNIIHVKVTGIDGSSNELNQIFNEEGDFVVYWYHREGTNEMDITAKSVNGIKQITYEWEGEEPVTVEATGEDEKEFTTTIEIKRGTNKLYVTATDLEGNIKQKEELIVGRHIPEITATIREKHMLEIHVIHDMGFKKIVIHLNGEEFVYDENHPDYSTQTKNLGVDVEVPTGTVELEVEVYTLEEENKKYTFSATTEVLD